MRTVRAVSVVVVLMLVANACSGGEPSAEPDQATPTTTVPPPSVGGSSEGLVDALEAAGVQVIETPGESGSGDGLELWSWQVENLAREIDAGGGYLGAQLDELVGSPGGLPFSYLLAGWLSAAPTPTAVAAAGLIGDQPWEQAPTLVFPTAVLALFVADAIAARGGTAGAPIRPMSLVAPTTGVCSTLSGWINGVLDFIFDSLKVEADTESFLGWLGTVWNAAVDLAKAAISGLVEVLTAPIVALITDALALIGTLSMIASLLRPWKLEVAPSNAQTRFAVGGEADISEQFTATVDTDIDFEWPAAIADCAQVAGLDLPDPSSAEDSEVEWKVVGLPPLGAVVEQETVIDDENSARLDWITGREESDRGEPLSGRVSVAVTVTSAQIEQLNAVL